MKTFQSSVTAACTLLLVGCSVEIKPTNAIARMASSTEIQNDAEASAARPDGEGVWVLLTALITKKEVQRISRWEVYPHVYIVECATGRDTNVGNDPRLEGVDFANFNSVKALVKAQPTRPTYQMQSLIFARNGDFRTPQCLQFRGGSYLGQKITEMRIPIRISGQLS